MTMPGPPDSEASTGQPLDAEPTTGFPLLTALWIVGAVAMAVLATSVYFWFARPAQDEGVELKKLTEGETVSLAGFFPPEEAPPLAEPSAIAVHGDTLFVAESKAGAVRVYSPDGSLHRLIVLPEENGEAASPVDLAVVDDDTLAVVDASGERVLLVDAAPGITDVLMSVVGEDDRKTAPRMPVAVAVANGTLVVADAASESLRSYDLAGTYLGALGEDAGLSSAGSLSGENGELYASDPDAGLVLVLDARTGQTLRVLQDIGIPRGVAVDEADRVFVVDGSSATVGVFGLGGHPQEAFGDGSQTSHALTGPTDAAWHQATARLYVTDAEAGRVIVFNVHPGAD